MPNKKILGPMLIVFSIILIFLLTFLKVNIDTQEAFLCEKVHSIPEIDIAQCPAHNSNVSWYILTSFGIAFLILGGGLYTSFMPERKKAPGYKKVDLSKLDKEERKIYQILRDNDGSIYQSNLIDKTGFTKVKITRILDKLEAKKILDRKRRGMTNIIILN